MALISESGVIRGKDEVLCSRCNADLSAEGSVTFLAHFDGRNDYGYQFTCKKCGNAITQTFSREPWD